MVTAHQALERLKEGNHRFVAGKLNRRAPIDHTQRAQLVKEQSPFAIILGCSDSRVPAELVFEQGIGDLFVIRVAGNIVAPSQVGSIEFAAEQFGTPLVVVMGHSHCGAVVASLDQLERRSHSPSPNLGFIVQRIQPFVEHLLDTELVHDRNALVEAAVRANIRASTEQLRTGSKVLKRLIRKKGLVIIGAEYSLATGVVKFFE